MTRAILYAMLFALLVPSAAPAQQPSPPPAAPQTTVDISRRGVTIASGVNSLTLGARPQFRWTLDDRESYDADLVGTGVGRADGAFTQFDVIRMRVSLSGGLYRPWFRYLVQLDFSRTGGDGASKIKDAVLEIRPVSTPIRFQAGQFKAPFGLQQLNSSGRLQFVDRAITDLKFNPGREMGVMVGGTMPSLRLGYEAGIFNGSGESARQNNQSVLWVGRAYFEPFGTYTLAEGSSDAGEKPTLHVGGAIRAGKAIRGRSPAGVVQDADDEVAYNVEFAIKARRFYSTAEHFWMTDEQSNPVPGPDIHSRGYHAQASVMVIPRTTEVGVQYAWIAGDTSVDDAAVTELRGVVSYYFQQHNLKLQADAGQTGFAPAFGTLSTRARQGLPALGPRLVTGEQLSDTQVRVQLTLIF